MFDNFTYLNWMVVAGGSGGFLGTLLAWLINYAYKTRTDEKDGDRRSIFDGILVSLAMGFVSAGLACGFSVFESNAMEDNSIRTTFILMSWTTLISGSLDTSSALVKKASSAILNLDSNSDN